MAVFVRQDSFSGEHNFAPKGFCSGLQTSPPAYSLVLATKTRMAGKTEFLSSLQLFLLQNFNQVDLFKKYSGGG